VNSDIQNIQRVVLSIPEFCQIKVMSFDVRRNILPFTWGKIYYKLKWTMFTKCLVNHNLLDTEKKVCILNQSIFLHTVTFWLIETDIKIEREEILVFCFQGGIPYQTSLHKIACILF
jgi:hypothetical protein